MGKIFFITATGTSVGKTFFSAILLKALMSQGFLAAYYKPVETGYLKGCSECDTVRTWTGNLSVYWGERYSLAASPHLAAEMEEKEVNAENIVYTAWELSQKYEAVVVEGAGGLAVPLNRFGENMGTLAKRLGAPLLLVADAGLGTLNHTLLTLEYAKLLKLSVNGIILNQYAENQIHRDNALILSEYAPVVSKIPQLKSVSPDHVNFFAQRLKGVF